MLGRIINPAYNTVGSQKQRLMRQERIYLSTFATIFFYGVTILLVIPIFELPIGGFSLSALLWGPILIEIWAKNRLTYYRKWIAWSYLFGLALLLSGGYNLISNSSEQIEMADVFLFVRYMFWLLVFVATVVVVSSQPLMPRLAYIMGIAICGLAMLRLGEAIWGGRWGAWSFTQLLRQNEYGWLFSTFSPFAFLLLLSFKGLKRLTALVGVLILLISIAGNGSRGSWGGVSAGVLVFILLFVSSSNYHYQQVTRLALIPFVVSGILLVLSLSPQSITEPITSRYSSLQSLDTDKSFVIRQLMIKKSQYLFRQTPLFGVGMRRFEQTYAPIQIPSLMGQKETERGLNQRDAHNTYWRYLAEAGIVGAIPYFGLLLYLVFQGVKATRSLAKPDVLWPYAVYSSFVGMSVHLWALSSLGNTATWFVYGLLGGMIEIAVWSQHQTRFNRSDLKSG